MPKTKKVPSKKPHPAEALIKSELIAKLVNKFQQLPENQVVEGVNAILSQISYVLRKKGRVEIRGFGSFAVRLQPERNSRDPRTGESLVTPAKYRPHFKPSKVLSATLREKTP